MVEEVKTEEKKEEVSPLLSEIRTEIGSGTQSTQNIKDTVDSSNLDESKKQEIKKALDD